MYAIVEIAGKQYKVQENDKLYVPRLNADADAEVTFDRVLLFAGDSDIRVGTPTVGGASVKARVLGHKKGDKVLVFRKIKRKRFKVKNGHRQQYTQIQVSGLSLG
jgi:large subunit ribosomal protein L21